MSQPTPAGASPWRDQVNGMLFVGLLAAAVVQLAAFPFVKSLGLSPLVVGIVLLGCAVLYRPGGATGTARTVFPAPLWRSDHRAAFAVVPVATPSSTSEQRAAVCAAGAGRP